jgi:predicted  nucleic acid-binding Zn-ribbon protein
MFHKWLDRRIQVVVDKAVEAAVEEGFDSIQGELNKEMDDRPTAETVEGLVGKVKEDLENQLDEVQQELAEVKEDKSLLWVAAAHLEELLTAALERIAALEGAAVVPLPGGRKCIRCGAVVCGAMDCGACGAPAVCTIP